MVRVDDRFLVRWIGATFAGWTLGFVFVLLLIGLSGAIGLGDSQFPVGLGMGLGVGLLQARLIKDHLGRGNRWLIASALGMAAPFVLTDVVRLQGQYFLSINVLFGGLIVGILQSLLLGQRARAPWSWIPVSVVGWTLAGATVAFNERYLPRIPGLIGALLYIAVVLLGGIVLGAIGGAALHITLKRTGLEGGNPRAH